MNFFDSAQLNENQIERNHFAVLALQKSLADFDAQLSYFTRYASVHFFPDPVGDLMFNGTATDVFRGSLVNGIQADTAWRMTDTHTIRSGLYVSGEKSLVQTNYQLLPIDATTGAQILPDIPFGVTDSSSLLGWLTGVYMSDEWKITDKLTFVSGLRFDQMNQYTNANQFSPRASVIYKATPSTTFHAGYARYFTPPVQVIAAPSNVALISSCPPSIPNCTTVQAPATPGPYGPVLPERSHVFDIGVLQDVFPGFKVGADAYFKYARDLLDDGQFGAAYVLNGFNYDRAQNIGELKGVYTNGNFKAYANWAWARQKATNIVSNQYLFSAADLDYIANHWIYTDHAQVWTGSAGVSYLWWGTRFTADMIYGSGLRAGDFNTDHVAPYAQVNMGLSHEFLIPGWRPVTARFDVVNVFDTIYSIRNGSGIGVFAPQFGPRRGYYFGLSQKFGPGPETPATPPPVYPLPVFAGIPVDKGLMSAKAPVAPLWSWAGFYLGANIGYSPAKPNTDAVFSDPTGATLFTDSASSRFRGVNGGVQAGYNSQWGSWLAGVEADVQGNSERAKVEFACPGAICNPAGIGTPVSVEHYRKLDRFATLRGRVGAMLTPDAVVYATGGAAVAGISNYGWINPDVDPAGNPIVDSNSTNILGRTMKWGFAVGGGVEARLLGNLTGKIEYFHLDFGTVFIRRVQSDHRASRRGVAQLASHRRHRAGRRELQFRSVLGDTGSNAGLPNAGREQSAILHQGADRAGVDLERLLSRRQYRLQLGSQQNRGAVQRQYRRRAVRDQRLVQYQRGDLRHPDRLQLAGGELARRHRRRHPDLEPARQADLRVSRLHLQSGRPGRRELRSKPQDGVVCDIARAFGRHRHPRYSRLRHRRLGRSRLHARRHRRELRLHGSGRNSHAVRHAQAQDRLGRRRRRRGPSRRAVDRQGRVPAPRLRHVRFDCDQRFGGADGDRGLQLPHHRQHRARGPEL